MFKGKILGMVTDTGSELAHGRRGKRHGSTNVVKALFLGTGSWLLSESIQKLQDDP